MLRSLALLLCLPPLPFHVAAAVPAGRQSIVSAFLYGWYSTPSVDGRWSHWNHSLLPHWTASVRERYPEASWRPPADLHSAF